MTYPLEIEQKVASVASKVAAQYARRCVWADQRDLEQEATIAALDARRTWDPERGVPFGAYAWRACTLHLGRWLLKASSPVSETWHNVANLKNVHHTPVDEAYAVVADGAYESVELAVWASEVREQVQQVLREQLSREHAQVANRVLLQNAEVEQAATEFGYSVVGVRRIARRARRLLKDNTQLFEMWRQM